MTLRSARQMALLHLNPEPKAICHTLSPRRTPAFVSMLASTYLQARHRHRKMLTARHGSPRARQATFCQDCYESSSACHIRRIVPSVVAPWDHDQSIQCCQSHDRLLCACESVQPYQEAVCTQGYMCLVIDAYLMLLLYSTL